MLDTSTRVYKYTEDVRGGRSDTELLIGVNRETKEINGLFLYVMSEQGKVFP